MRCRKTKCRCKNNSLYGNTLALLRSWIFIVLLCKKTHLSFMLAHSRVGWLPLLDSSRDRRTGWDRNGEDLSIFGSLSANKKISPQIVCWSVINVTMRMSVKSQSVTRSIFSVIQQRISLKKDDERKFKYLQNGEFFFILTCPKVRRAGIRLSWLASIGLQLSELSCSGSSWGFAFIELR